MTVYSLSSVLLAVGAFACAGCSLFFHDTSYDPVIDSAQFVSGVDNPFFPLVPGATYRYHLTDGGDEEDIVISVTNETRVVAGVTCIVVRELVREGAEVIEDNRHWYAQDQSGDVWYFGEDAKEYDKGRIRTEGSWEAGVSGAKPGILMLGKPEMLRIYRQQYCVGEAEGEAQVVGFDQTVKVAGGTFSGCLKILEWSRLDPGEVVEKYYAPGVGEVASRTVEGGVEQVELVGR